MATFSRIRFGVLWAPLLAACSSAPKPTAKAPTTTFDPKTEVMIAVKASSESEAFAAALPRQFRSQRSPTIDNRIRTDSIFFGSDAKEEIMIFWQSSDRADFVPSARANIAEWIRKGAPPISHGSFHGALNTTVFRKANPRISMMKPTNVTATLLDGKDYLVVDYSGNKSAGEAEKEVRRILDSMEF